MAVPYWCILVAASLPYLWTLVAKLSGERYDNRDPRAWLGRQSQPRVARANAAQLNGFEAFAPFAAAVLMAQAAGLDRDTIATLAVAFVMLRVLHGVFYVANQHYLRSAVWFGGVGCVAALMVQAALAIG